MRAIKPSLPLTSSKSEYQTEHKTGDPDTTKHFALRLSLKERSHVQAIINHSKGIFFITTADRGDETESTVPYSINHLQKNSEMGGALFEQQSSYIFWDLTGAPVEPTGSCLQRLF